jgi:hypothetical protein
MTVFLMNTGEEFFIRELTRKLNEQINSIRRELDNMKKMGFLKSKTKNRKKYYYVNKDFILLEDLRNIIIKALSSNQEIGKNIVKLGDIKLLVLSGQFINLPTTNVDMLLVGDIDKEKLAKYLNEELRTERAVKFSILKEDDYKYRINCKDKFVTDIINDPNNQILIDKTS